MRDGDPVGDLDEQLAELAPVLESLEFDEHGEATLDTDATSQFLRELMPELERAERAGAAADGVGPRARAHPRQRQRAPGAARSAEPSGLLSTDGARELRLATRGRRRRPRARPSWPSSRPRRARSCASPAAGRRSASRTSQRALRFLERRKRGGGVVDLVRTVSGLETDEAGLELGDVTLDTQLTRAARR